MTLNWDWTGWALWSTSHFWSVTLTVLIIVGILEVFREAQPLLLPAWQRWSAHVFLTILIQLCLNPLRAISGHALAAWATSHQIGLFSLTSLSLDIRCILGILLLDLIHYASHLLYHHSSWLWSLHAIHHNDEDFDWSTGYRFHISEFLATLMIESIGVLIIGLPPESILHFVLLISIQNLLSHANFLLPAPLARWLDCIEYHPTCIASTTPIQSPTSNRTTAFSSPCGTVFSEPSPPTHRTRLKASGLALPRPTLTP
ncbi:MAG: sterol desaturase family protein [Acidobacteriota bacterium]